MASFTQGFRAENQQKTQREVYAGGELHKKGAQKLLALRNVGAGVHPHLCLFQLKCVGGCGGLPSVQDTYIQLKNPTTNSGSNVSAIIDRETTDLQRALLQFDLSSIPSGSTVTSAVLKLQSTQICGSITI